MNAEHLPDDTASQSTGIGAFIGVGLVMIAIGLGGIWYCQDDIRRAYAGPTNLSADEIGQVEHLSQLESPWVGFQSPKVIPTKVDLIRS